MRIFYFQYSQIGLVPYNLRMINGIYRCAIIEVESMIRRFFRTFNILGRCEIVGNPQLSLKFIGLRESNKKDMDEIFKKQVYELVRLIPKGRVSTYGAIAKALGYPNHSRHVGKAMGGCPGDVPAHRVISSGGVLSVPEFQIKLEDEGVVINNLRIKDFKKIFWNPMHEL